MEAKDDGSAKRQRLMAGMPILHETGVDVSVDAHKMVVLLAAMLDDQGQWTQRVVATGTRNSTESRVEPCLTHRRCHEGRLRELANTEKLEVAETIQLQVARAQSLEIVHSGWTMRKGRQKTRMLSGADRMRHR